MIANIISEASMLSSKSSTKLEAFGSVPQKFHKLEAVLTLQNIVNIYQDAVTKVTQRLLFRPVLRLL